MIAAFYGKHYSLERLREKSFITRLGVSMLGISEAAEKIGFRTMGVQISFQQLLEDAPLPCIVHWNQQHFVVVYRMSKGQVWVADPGADAVAVAQSRGYRVVPMVGPSSLLLALMASGFNGQCFAFAGYLPVDAAARQRRMRDMEGCIRRMGQTQIFIETPYRNNRLIPELCRALPGTLKLCVASDITGPRESIITRTLAQWAKASYDYDKIPTIFLLGQ